MYDRPTLAELLDAVRGHLESAVIPAIKGDAKLYFQTLVAVNVLKVAERELVLAADHRRARWNRTAQLMGETGPFPSDPAQADAQLEEWDRQLCAAIRSGAYRDREGRTALFAHLMTSAREALEVANPKLLSTLEAEDRLAGHEQQ